MSYMMSIFQKLFEGSVGLKLYHVALYAMIVS